MRKMNEDTALRVLSLLLFVGVMVLSIVCIIGVISAIKDAQILIAVVFGAIAVGSLSSTPIVLWLGEE